MREIRTFQDAEAYINDIPRFTKKNTMEDTKAFLHSIGDPDRSFKIIHVAGTNGKGSVCAYLRSVLEAAGYRVAVFTSPHLVNIRERFVADGEMISEEDFLRIFLSVYKRIMHRSGGDPSLYHPTFFEYLFFMAMLWFAEKAPDFCILETGLGGRLDATNSVAKKELAVITRIGLDHVEYLGNSLEEIAGEKAGILQPCAPVVYWETNGKVSAVIEGQAAKLGVTTHPVSKSDYRLLRIGNKTIDFSLNTRYYNYISLTVRTIALYQMENVALAVRAAEILCGGKSIAEARKAEEPAVEKRAAGHPVTEEQIRQGILNCFWAGRMEEVLPETYVDGAHNEDGIRAFLEAVAADAHVGPRSLLFGVVKDKDYGRMVEEIAQAGLFDRVYVAHLQTGRGVSTAELQRVFAEVYPDCDSRFFDTAAEAWRELLDSRAEGERIYAAGSLYLVGEIKEMLDNDKF